MALFTDKISISYTGNGSPVTAVAVTKTADAQSGFDISLPTASTNIEADVTCRQAGIQMAILVSDQPVRICTNAASTGTPQETINLTANAPLVYYAGGPVAVPFAGDVTALFITNVSGAAAHVQIRVLYDSTP